MLNTTDKLRSALDLVLSARLINTEIEKLKEKVHCAADPHVALSTSSKNPTIENCTDLVTEVAMIDAAATLSEESLKEIEGYSRAIAKIVAHLEVIDAMGGTTAPAEMMEDLENAYLESTLRFDELRHLRDIMEMRAAELVAQL